MQLTQEQFAEHLNDRLSMLVRSAEAYDQGDYYEAIRMAGSIVKIIGDRKRSNGKNNENFTSLSTQLGIKPNEMIDTSLSGAMDREDLHGPLFILGFTVAGAAGLVPLLDGFQRDSLDPARYTPFEKWWNASVIRDGKGNEFSRREIIEAMRDQEDAHSDSQLNSKYASIAYEGAIGISEVNSNHLQFDLNPARVVVRQVAHEILRTFCSSKLPPKWIQTKGLKVQPIALFEIQEDDGNGHFMKVTNHKAIEFKSESTASPDVWESWESFAKEMPINATSNLHQTYEIKNWQTRVILLNFAPYPIEGIQAMVSMQHPVN